MSSRSNLRTAGYWLLVGLSVTCGMAAIALFCLGGYGMWFGIGKPVDKLTAASAFVMAGAVLPVVFSALFGTWATNIRERQYIRGGKEFPLLSMKR